MISRKADWRLTTANIYTVDLTEPTRGNSGHYDVIYTYRVGEEIYTGKFSDYDSTTESCLKPDDSIQIRYNPANPKQSYYPEVRGSDVNKLLVFGIPVAFALIILIVVYLSGGFR